MRTNGGHNIINFEVFESDHYKMYIGEICNPTSHYHQRVITWDKTGSQVFRDNEPARLDIDINTIDEHFLKLSKTRPWKPKMI